MSQQKLSQLSRKEIQRQIHNLTVKKWRLKKSQEDPNWVIRERKRKKAVYYRHSESRIQTQMKWNQANRVKTRKYNKKHYEKFRKRITKHQNDYYANNKKKILAARRKKK